jgi:outer membrane protein assembly factor BamA
MSAYLGYDSRDVSSNTSTGWWNEVALSWESGLFGSTSDFRQIDLDLRRYIFLWDRHTLALFSLSTLRTGTVGKEVAPWQLFAVGGTSTVRGWEFAARNGKNQFVNTVEYRLTLLRPQLIVLPFNLNVNSGMHLAFFGDLGIGWSEANQFAGDNFIGGFGVGLRFLVPFVNMLRMDFGWGQSGKGVFLHLGAFEKPYVARRRVR